MEKLSFLSLDMVVCATMRSCAEPGVGWCGRGWGCEGGEGVRRGRGERRGEGEAAAGAGVVNAVYDG